MVATKHDHPSLTEPVVSRHLVEVHGWSKLRVYNNTYFQRLVAHNREHKNQSK